MANMLIRNLSAVMVQKLKKQAKNNGRSLQSEAKQILEKGIELDRTAYLKEIDAFRNSLKHKKQADSVILLRQDRSR